MLPLFDLCLPTVTPAHFCAEKRPKTTHITGGGKYQATYNATKTGNYSLEIIDASDGEHAVGSPFEVVVEAAQAFAPATLVWWDRQVQHITVSEAHVGDGLSLRVLYASKTVQK